MLAPETFGAVVGVPVPRDMRSAMLTHEVLFGFLEGLGHDMPLLYKAIFYCGEGGI